MIVVFFFKQKTAYEMRISDWSSDVCSSDLVFIDDYDALPVEASRKLPLAMAGDLESGQIVWRGKGVLNPFEADGRLASLADYPRFSAYLHAHRDAVVRRHVAGRNPAGWYRTIDRISPSLEIGRASCRERVCQYV